MLAMLIRSLGGTTLATAEGRPFFPFVDRYGKYVLIRPDEIDTAPKLLGADRAADGHYGT